MKKFIKMPLYLLLIFSLLLSGCSKETTKNDSGSAGKLVENKSEFKGQITFNGSSTLAPVLSAISTEFIEDKETWDKVDSKFPEENISIYVSAGGSGAGVKSVLEATSDFGMLARELKDEEKEKLGDFKEYKLGIDALTISINPENPLNKLKDDLTSDEIKDIFSGKISKWSQLDPSLPDRDIVVVTRDLGGGAHSVFQKAIMGEEEVKKDVIQASSMGALVTKVIENVDAIGYASFGMVNQNEGKLIPLKVDSIEPTKENIINGSYKISRPLIVVTSGDLTEAEESFVKVLTSEESGKIIEDMGFVPVN